MPIWGRSRDAKVRRITAAMTAGLLLTGCATATPKTLANLTVDETQTIDQTCQQTFGARPGDVYFDACRTSLASAMAQRDDAQRLAKVTADCARAGGQPGSSEQALCVLGAPASAAPQRLKSLTVVSPAEVHRRIQLSCAKLGLDPAAIAFSNCVTEFEGQLTAAVYPSA